MTKYIAPKLLFMLLFSVSLFTLQAQHKNEFANTILAGFYPDPSICRVGDNYYLVNSTFSKFLILPEYIIQ